MGQDRCRVQGVLGEGLVGMSLEQRDVCVKCVCSGAGRGLQPAPASLRGEKPNQSEAAGETGGKQSPDEFRGKGIPGRDPQQPVRASCPAHTEYPELDP